MGERIRTQSVLGDCHQRPTSPSHDFPIVFIGRSAGQAYLIVTSVVVDPRPREPVPATSNEKLL